MYHNKRNIDDEDYVPTIMINKFINTDLANPKQSSQLMIEMDTIVSDVHEGFIAKAPTSSEPEPTSSKPEPTYITLTANEKILKNTIEYNNRHITSVGGGIISWNATDQSIHWSKPIHNIIVNEKGLYKISVPELPIQLKNNNALIYKINKSENITSSVYPKLINLFAEDDGAPIGIYDAKYVNSNITILNEVRGFTNRNGNITGATKYNDDNLPMIVGNNAFISFNNILPKKTYTIASLTRNILPTETINNKLPNNKVPLNISSSEHFTNNQLTLTDIDNNINNITIAIKELNDSQQDILLKRTKLDKILETEINNKKNNEKIITDLDEKYNNFISKKESVENIFNREKGKNNDNILALKQKYSNVITLYENAKKNINKSDKTVNNTREKINGLIIAQKNIDDKLLTLKNELTNARDTRISLEDVDTEEDTPDIEVPTVEVDTILDSSDMEEDSDSDTEDESDTEDDEESETKEKFTNNVSWDILVETLTGNDLLKIPIDNIGVSLIILWDRELNDEEKNIVNGALLKYSKTRINIIESINIPKPSNNDLFTIDINRIGKYYDNNSILLAVNLQNGVKYMPENITFQANQSNTYDSNNGNWKSRIIKPTIVMSKRTGKKWLATLNNKGEIILTNYKE